MKIKEITDAIERFAPLALQEGYDNAGLVVGDPEREVGRALLAVDVTEEVLAEAEREGCDLVVTHHPIVFHPLKRLNEADYVQRCVARAVRRDIALYAWSRLGEALRAGAELYLTADLKYNDFMAPSGRLTVADIGHFESEYCAIEILFEIFSKNLRTFAVRKSRCSCNPVNYLCL